MYLPAFRVPTLCFLQIEVLDAALNAGKLYNFGRYFFLKARMLNQACEHQPTHTYIYEYLHVVHLSSGGLLAFLHRHTEPPTPKAPSTVPILSQPPASSSISSCVSADEHNALYAATTAAPTAAETVELPVQWPRCEPDLPPASPPVVP